MTDHICKVCKALIGDFLLGSFKVRIWVLCPTKIYICLQLTSWQNCFLCIILILTVSVQPRTKCWLRPSGVFSTDADDKCTATESPGECMCSLSFYFSLPATQKLTRLRFMEKVTESFIEFDEWFCFKWPHTVNRSSPMMLITVKPSASETVCLMILISVTSRCMMMFSTEDMVTDNLVGQAVWLVYLRSMIKQLLFWYKLIKNVWRTTESNSYD